MAMPDAIAALLALLEAPAASLTGSVYNVAAFNPSAGELADLVRRAFPDARITFVPDPRRQADHRLVARGRRRHRGPARLGLPSGLRSQAGLRGIPDAEHPAALPAALIREDDDHAG